MKKRFCLMLAVLLAAGAFASCAARNTETPDAGVSPQGTADAGTVPEPETAPETEEEIPAPPVEDMKGAVLTIMNMTPSAFNWANTQIFAAEMNGEILNDALYAREQKVEELYNCSIEERETTDRGGGDMSAAVKSGDFLCLCGKRAVCKGRRVSRCSHCGTGSRSLNGRGHGTGFRLLMRGIVGTRTRSGTRPGVAALRP